MDNERNIDNRKVMKNILSLLKDYKLRLFFSIVFIFLSVLFVMYGPILIGDAITIVFDGANNIIHHRGTIDFDALFHILILAIIIYIASSLFEYLQRYLIMDMAVTICFTLRERLMIKVTHLPMDKIEGAEVGDILSRITNDVETLEDGMIAVISTLLKSIITIVSMLIIMFSINVWMTLAIVILVPITFIIIRIMSKFSQKYFKNQLNLKGSVNTKIEETFAAHDVIRSFNYDNILIDSFKDNNNHWYDNEWKAQFFASINYPLMTFISNFMLVLIAVLGAFFVIQGAMPVGRIVTFFQYSNNFSQPILQITAIMPNIQLSLAAGDRIFEFLNQEDEENLSSRELTEFNDEITFENVSFSYVEGENVIDDLSFTVKKGETIAIVGETGSGKTTIVKLLLRFYDLDSGEIKIDGVNIEDYEKNSFRSFIGMVLQDSWLFSDTIENNIRYGKLDAAKDEIISASKQANADNFIRQLPNGYETILNEDSDNLSYGQRQLLTIARTFISRKQILIFDEATSSVDTRTEKLIQKAMNHLIKNRTSFIIAHRLSTITNADNIIVIENGTIIEQGTHEELLAKRGYYFNTLNNQN